MTKYLEQITMSHVFSIKNLFLYKAMFCFLDTETVENIKNVCRACSENSSKICSPSLDAMFFTPSSTQVLYNLEVRNLQCFEFW